MSTVRSILGFTPTASQRNDLCVSLRMGAYLIANRERYHKTRKLVNFSLQSVRSNPVLAAWLYTHYNTGDREKTLDKLNLTNPQSYTDWSVVKNSAGESGGTGGAQAREWAGRFALMLPIFEKFVSNGYKL